MIAVTIAAKAAIVAVAATVAAKVAFSAMPRENERSQRTDSAQRECRKRCTG